MKINLRKASSLQQNILDAIKAINLTSTVSFNEFEDSFIKWTNSNTKFVENFKLCSELYDSLYFIRNLVGKANAEQINGLLGDVALTEKKIQLYSVIANTEPSSREYVAAKIEKIKNINDASTLMYGRSNEVVSGIFTEYNVTDAKSSISTLKKQKQKLQDKILELNITTEIELPSNVVDVLKKADLI